MKLILLVLGICFCMSCQSQNEAYLFPFWEKNRVGFIDNRGNVIIKPTFRSAGNFSEGLIAARINSLYGYIDKTGEFVIKPQFEYATDFKEGFAIVMDNNIPSFINKNGQKPFKTIYATLNPFENGRATVETKSKKKGVIDRNGQLLIDTIYSFIDTIGFGLSKVQIMDTTDGDRKIGIIDTLGNYIVPLGKYEGINPFVGDYSRVSIYALKDDSTGESAQTGFIDTKGNIMFLRGSSKKAGWLLEDMHNGIAKMIHYKYWIPEEEGVLSTSEKNYDGYINLRGEVILNDTLVEDVTDFSDERAFIKMRYDEGYYLVDTQLKKVSNKKFDHIFYNGFYKGYAFVTVGESNKYGLINTKGEFIFKPQFEEINYGEIIENYFFYGVSSPTKEEPYRILFGVAEVTGKILFKPKFEEFDRSGYKNGLLKVRINKKFSYVDKKGKIVWQEKQDEWVDDLDIDFMKRGDFYAHSEPDKKDIESSKNAPQKINNIEDFAQNQLSIVVKTNQLSVIDNKWNGYKVYIANTTNGDIQFNAQDNRLYMKLQAQDSTGLWKDIEYLPSSWCGNSYHTLTLKKQNFWDFSVPKYHGDMKTKVRVELTYNDPNSKTDKRDTKTITIYSNEFEARINPSQFWRKQDYFTSSIMDPYND